jgi:hypothetical protein
MWQEYPHGRFVTIAWLVGPRWPPAPVEPLEGVLEARDAFRVHVTLPAETVAPQRPADALWRTAFA